MSTPQARADHEDRDVVARAPLRRLEHRVLDALGDDVGRHPRARRQQLGEVAGRIEAAVLTASEGRLRDDMAILAFGPTHQPLEEAGILPGATSTEETDG